VSSRRASAKNSQKWFAKGYAAVALRTAPGNRGVSPHSLERFLGKGISAEAYANTRDYAAGSADEVGGPVETSMDRTDVRRILLVQADVDGVIGWAECVAGETPFYSPETADTAWLILRDFLWPLIKGKEFASAGEVWDLLARVRGHNMAKGSLEAAVWDAEANKRACRFQNSLGAFAMRSRAASRSALKSPLDELAAAVQKELAAGYQRIR